MKRYLKLEGAILGLIMLILFGCVSESRFLKNESIDNIITREPLPPPPPDAACHTLPRFRALSLKELQKAVQVDLKNDKKPNAIQFLCGLKTIEGFLIDRKNHDLLIIGKDADTMPPLLLNDFIIALRCAWKKYVADNMFTPPGCSIDPSPNLISRLKEIEARITAEESSSKWKNYKDEYELACKQPQTVRVLGMPFNTHFASVLVKADYGMKRLVDGSDSIDIPGVVDLYALNSYDMRQAMLAQTDAAKPASTLNRFWFKPDQFHFIEQRDLVILDKCEISLLTEEQHLTKNNEIAGNGRTDPFAEKVADCFTTYYTYIAQKRPIYRQLKELMRMYIVLEAIYNKDAEMKADLQLDYLLDAYHVPEYFVSPSLPGRSRYEIEAYERKTIDEIQQAAFVMPMCGGVAFEVFFKERHFSKVLDASLTKILQAIINQKPHARALFWDIVMADDESL
jgi:hypothetical protein